MEKLQQQSKEAGFTPLNEEELSHGQMVLSDVLAHHGVKGMRWGVRKANAHPVSEDHANAEAGKTKAKEGGLSALSNKELQDVITRKNLEKQYNELNGAGGRFDKGHKHIQRILKAGKTFGDTVNTIETTGKAVKKGIKIAKDLNNAINSR